MKRPSARPAGAKPKTKAKLRLVKGGLSPTGRTPRSPRLISCEDGFCPKPERFMLEADYAKIETRMLVEEVLDPPNPAWARLGLAAVLGLDFEIPGLRRTT